MGNFRELLSLLELEEQNERWYDPEFDMLVIEAARTCSNIAVVVRTSGSTLQGPYSIDIPQLVLT